MNDIFSDFVNNVRKMRQAVIDAGGRPTTIKISQSAIEEIKLFGMNIEIVSPVLMPKDVKVIVVEDKDMLHQHDWLIVKADVRYRDTYLNEFVIDFYRCYCGAGGRVKTPLAEYRKGNKVLGITEIKEDTI